MSRKRLRNGEKQEEHENVHGGHAALARSLMPQLTDAERVAAITNGAAAIDALLVFACFEAVYEDGVLKLAENTNVCVCGQQIWYNFWIRHKASGICTIVGRVCIETFKPELHTEIYNRFHPSAVCSICNRRNKRGTHKKCEKQRDAQLRAAEGKRMQDEQERALIQAACEAAIKRAEFEELRKNTMQNEAARRQRNAEAAIKIEEENNARITETLRASQSAKGRYYVLPTWSQRASMVELEFEQLPFSGKWFTTDVDAARNLMRTAELDLSMHHIDDTANVLYTLFELKPFVSSEHAACTHRQAETLGAFYNKQLKGYVVVNNPAAVDALSDAGFVQMTMRDNHAHLK